MRRAISMILLCGVFLVQMPLQSSVLAGEYEGSVSKSAEEAIEAEYDDLEYEYEKYKLKDCEFEDYEDEQEIEDETKENVPSTTANVISSIGMPITITPFAGVIESGTVGTGGANWYLYDDYTLVVHGGTIQWNDVISPWFAYNSNIERIVFKYPVTAGTHLRALFADLTNVKEIKGLYNVDTSNVISMANMFDGAHSLESIEGLFAWDTGRVTHMVSMFRGANSLENLDLSGWDTSSVTTMSSMFSGASSLKSLDLSGWNTRNVTHMSWMFYGASSLTDIGDLSSWETGSVVNMRDMFANASSLKNLDLSGWNTNNVATMLRMFTDASSLECVGDLSGWETGNVTNMYRMFGGVSSLTSLDLSSWNTENVTQMGRMFYGASSLERIGDLSGWDTGNVTTMRSMFEGASSFESLDLSSWETGNVTTMYRMFADTSELTCVGDLSGWDTSEVTSMGRMFNGASSLTGLDLSGWDTGKVTHMSNMFEDANSLERLDLSGWNAGNTSNVTTMLNMFLGATALRELTLGENFAFRANAALPAVPNNDRYAGRWQNVGYGTVSMPTGEHMLTSAQLMSMFDGSTMADTWVWQRTPFWAINLTGNHMFPDAVVGYDAKTPHSAMVTNTGNMPTGVLTIALSGANQSSFTLSTNSIDNIGVGGTANFMVVPVSGLLAGVYTVTVTVSGDNGILESFIVSFTVSIDPKWGISLPDDKIFPSAMVGYDAKAPFSVTVTNIENQPTGELTVKLSGTNAASFTICKILLDCVAVGESIVGAFTVVPNMGLEVGEHTAIVTVSGGNGISEFFNVSFTVNSGSNNDNNAGGGDNAGGLSPDLGPVFPDNWIGSGGETGTFAVDGVTLPTVLGHVSFVEEHIAYISGFPDGTVRPSQAITRAEIAMILFRLLDSNTKHLPQASHFSDVQTGNWYAQAVNYLAEHGVLVGCYDGTFRPNDSMTRAELAAVMSRFFELAESGMSSFYDVDANHWAFNYIMNAEGRAWITGYEDRTFRPDNAIIRAEAVTLINRVLNRNPNPTTIRQHLTGVTVFTDISQGHWAFYQIMEAAIEHEFEFNADGLEVWIRIISLPPHEAR